MTPNSRTSQRAVLGTRPTAPEPMPRPARAIGPGAGDLRVKRDDLTGLGGGGNKVRKLEWACGAALAAGATAHRRHRARPDLHRTRDGGLIAAVEDGDVVPGQRMVFLHSGGVPGPFGHAATLARLEEALTPSTP
ncbi:hypothetical protein ACFU9X_28310 [Streptomyces atratus]|uniref:hypothetical protein n=1 Tax=Streptomyces atratus TaxID=1893 RepID=UPI0036CCF76D